MARFDLVSLDGKWGGEVTPDSRVLVILGPEHPQGVIVCVNLT